ncbi:MAG: GAF domain-containing protein, partial [Spirochaetota bacterium]
ELTRYLERTVSERTEELRELNSRLETELAVRKRIEENMRESEHKLKESQRISHVGSWELNLTSKVLTWSDEVYRIFEIHPHNFNPIYEAFLDTIHPDDRETVDSAYSSSLSTKIPYSIDHRLLFSDGRIKHVHEQCETFYEGDTPIRSIGTVQDITDRKRAEEALSLNAERMEVLLYLHQMAGQTLEEITKYAFEAAVGLTRSQLGYLVFVNEDETLLTMQLWSQEAMSECKIHDKPKIFPVETTGLWGEAVRQRRPIITNDYSAPSPWKKGTPEGHVPLKRHLNLPVIVGGRIVLVAGVGNKVEEYNDADVNQLALLMEGMWLIIERKKAQEKLLKNNEELEQRVHDRTMELEAKNEELERINRIFVGRELRMTELKEKMKEMESRNGPPEK